MVGSYLKYCIPAWCLLLTKDITALERVQRRVTKMIKVCQGLKDKERLKCFGK